MSRAAKTMAIFFILTFVVSNLAVTEAFAQTPVRKLGRGLANTITGILELPANIMDVAQDDGYLAAMSYGAVKGLFMSFFRIGTGLYETFTFPLPLPWGYEPILEPEFMMTEDTF